MDPVTNPFAPGAGTEPPELAGRDAILERTRVTIGRVAVNNPAKSFMLVGLRGVGKTVLLNKVQEIAVQMNCLVAQLETPEDKPLPELMVPALRRILLQLDTKERVEAAVKRGLMILKGFASAVRVGIGDIELGLDVESVRGIADSGDVEADLPDLFQAVGEAARSRGRVVILIVDEIQYIREHEFSALIMALHRISQRRLPFILIGAGLPQLVGLAGRSKSYAERLFDYPIVGQLAHDDACSALLAPAQREGVEFEPAALDCAIRLTEGYPYFLQEWGYHSWNVAVASPITVADVEAATPAALASLDESFFRVRFDRLTPREKDYLYAMAELGPGPHRSGDVASRLKVKVESIAPVRSALIKKGMVFSPAHGDTAFTVPMFDAYLTRSRAIAS